MAEHLMAMTGQLLEEMMATYHSLGIAGKVAGKFIHHPVGLPTALVEMWCGTYQDVLSSVFWTVGDAGTHLHPQFFTESHGSGFRSDQWCRVWDPGQACLDDDACISCDFVVGSQADSCRFYSEATFAGVPSSANLRRALRPLCEGHQFVDRQ